MTSRSTSTIRADQGSSAAAFHDDAIFGPVAGLTLAIVAIAAVRPAPDGLSIAAVIAVIALLGIPHGSLDHLAAEALAETGQPTRRARFVRNYLVGMAAVAVLWLVAAPLALVGFLALSVHHFGQSDLAYLGLGGPLQLVLQWSRGVFLVGLALVAHVDVVAPVVRRLGGGDPVAWGWLVGAPWLWCGLLVAQHLVVGAIASHRGPRPAVVAREAVAVAVLTLLLVTVDPLLGFAVYFGLWHSLAHLLVLVDLLATGPRPIRSVARRAAPLTVVSLVGLTAGSTVAVALGGAELLVPVVVVFISMLTLPHMVVVERMWRRSSSHACERRSTPRVEAVIHRKDLHP